MPGRDGTGPLGMGAMTGRGLGLRFGSGCRRSFGIAISKSQKELLAEQKDLLESRLNVINKQIQSL